MSFSSDVLDSQIPECATCFDEEGSYACLRFAHSKKKSARQCTEPHPRTGDPCVLYPEHTGHTDPRVRQHVTGMGLRWPLLHELDPEEGWSPPLPHRL